MKRALRLVPLALLCCSAVLLASRAAAASTPDTASLYAKAARFEADTQPAHAAIVHIAVLKTLGRFGQFDNEASLLLAHAYERYGLPQQARDALHALLQDKQVPQRVRNRAWLALARQQIAEGDTRQAKTELQQVSKAESEQLKARWKQIRRRLIEARKQQDKTASVLAPVAVRITSAKGANARFQQYNRAMAYLNNGKPELGLWLLNAVGTMHVRKGDANMAALRDRANLALGYYFLDAGQGATAEPVLERIRLKGPFSDPALLAMGWAELAPRGKVQRRASYAVIPCAGSLPNPGNSPVPLLWLEWRTGVNTCTQQPYILRKIVRSFSQTNHKKDSHAAALKRALIPWRVLANRSTRHQSVQEASLAIGYALESLHRNEAAFQAYKETVKRLEAEDKSQLKAVQDARDGSLIHALLKAKPGAQEATAPPTGLNSRQARYLPLLLANRQFQNNYINYRDLVYLRSLSGGQLSPQEKSGLQRLLDNEESFLRRMAAHEFRHRRKITQRYLSAARLGLARLSDREQQQGDGS